jgi:hypothetical protein
VRLEYFFTLEVQGCKSIEKVKPLEGKYIFLQKKKEVKHTTVPHNQALEIRDKNR